MDFFAEIGWMNKRQLLLQGLNLGMIITSVLMIWKSMILVTGSKSPVSEGAMAQLQRLRHLPPGAYVLIVDCSDNGQMQCHEMVVVLSGSMEPGFYRGDILFLYQPKKPSQTGDIIVFNTDDHEIPTVHRIIKMHHRTANSSSIDILTKGDNNSVDDRGGVYPKGQLWLNPGHIMGVVVGYLPHIGRVTLMMNDYPMFKYALTTMLGIFVLIRKE